MRAHSTELPGKTVAPASAPRTRRLFVQCPVVFLSREGVGEGTLFNLSAGGAAIESGTAVQRGTVLTLRMHPPQFPQPIAVDQAEVVWTAGNDFGVQFLSLGTRDQARLSQLIAGLLSGGGPCSTSLSAAAPWGATPLSTPRLP